MILNILFVLAFGTPIFGIPIACAVAVLRYRLYDLDVVVKKTVVAAVVAAAFTAVYVLVVVAVGAVTGHPGGSPLTFAAAALAAVLLQPVRVRAGQLADRLVYGRRATPYEVLSEFSGQMRGTYSTEDVLPQNGPDAGRGHRGEAGRGMAATAGASTWRRRGRPPRVGPRDRHGGHRGAGRPGAGHGCACLRRGRSRAASEESAGGRDDGIAPAFVVEHQGERLGALRITSSPREPLTPAGERLVRDVAAQAGLVLRNVALIEDLRASRQRLVAAADEARRRLERNLHDGAQQRLVALRITLGLARQVAGSSPQEADELLAQTEQAGRGRAGRTPGSRPGDLPAAAGRPGAGGRA